MRLRCRLFTRPPGPLGSGSLQASHLHSGVRKQPQLHDLTPSNNHHHTPPSISTSSPSDYATICLAELQHHYGQFKGARTHAGSRACDAQRPATSAPVHRAQDREMPASTHRVRSMKGLGSWEGASAFCLKSPVSDTGASKEASFGYACEDENLLSLHRLVYGRSMRRTAFDRPPRVMAALFTEAWAGESLLVRTEGQTLPSF